MNVLVASVEEKSYDFRAQVHEVGYEKKEQSFSMPRPIGDDWLQRISHRPSVAPELVRVQDRTMFILFASIESAESFATWLVSAEAEAQASHRTMRG